MRGLRKEASSFWGACRACTGKAPEKGEPSEAPALVLQLWVNQGSVIPPVPRVKPMRGLRKEASSFLVIAVLVRVNQQKGRVGRSLRIGFAYMGKQGNMYP